MILEFLGGKPDLIIGNYSDGNLVASLMASKLGITQVSSFISLERYEVLVTFLCILGSNLTKFFNT